ncbi:hypothetical protein H257_03340 [Aphanomyces astaci]|uniref:Uncharacterized protein n=1 Tax=Aphanomyces astaci TaxID=112090 RepID=W4GYF9_APHAT|nr:hypothetical protein H257_03340 [Aphanomyces astaci]ETV83963.1 hypothetical protein H257_03340 [Aphanomyces astaci]|eukprot:XP_009825655.1 hypothetical protein H257_03340 [Aphanomyces astaci]
MAQVRPMNAIKPRRHKGSPAVSTSPRVKDLPGARGNKLHIDFRFPSLRRALFTKFSLKSVVGAMRNNPVEHQLNMYCWLDFGHATKRQARCSQWTTNAAMAAHIPWLDVMNDKVSIPLRHIQSGITWVEAMLLHTLVSLSDEVPFWRAVDAVDVVTAFGLCQRITISKTPSGSNELMTASVSNKQNIMPGLKNDLSCNTEAFELPEAHFQGPLNSIDFRMVDIPGPLSAYFRSFQASLPSLIQTNSSSPRYICMSHLDGGSPLCMQDSFATYPQMPSCGSSSKTARCKSQCEYLRRNSTYALRWRPHCRISASNVDQLCSLCTATEAVCVDMLASATLSQVNLTGLERTVAINATASLNISLIQSEPPTLS